VSIQRNFAITLVPRRWYEAFACTSFKLKLIAGLLLLAMVLSLLPGFFQIIEKRENLIVINDPVLQMLEPADFSVAIFVVMWGTTLFFLYRCVHNPVMFVQAIYALVVLCVIRLACIYLVPLAPPEGLIKLIDPLSSLTYGGTNVFITKDLFFSGHTSNMLILVICFQQKMDKWIAAISATLIGVMVLLQHVHYTIDVVAAVIISFLLVPLVKRWVNKGVI
jgi:hypothetical protein